MLSPVCTMPFVTRRPSGRAYYDDHRRRSDSGRSDGHSAQRAAAFVADHLGECLCAERIAKASGLSKRTLHRVFLQDFGVPPMVLVRLLRLLKARAELEAPSPETTVTTAAMRWGLTHLGRFARDYARQFGEAPSVTLRRARELGSPTLRVL